VIGTVCRLSNSGPLFQPQLTVQLLDGAITLAGGCFEFLAVHDVDGGPTVLDGFVLLQNSSRKCDRRAVGAEHGGEEIVRERKATCADPVVGHEQPAGQSLLDFVEAIAGGGLRNLHALEDSVAIQAHLELGSRLERRLKRTRGDAEAVARNLYDDAKRAPIETDGQSGADRPFASHDSCFDFPSAAHGNDNGGQAAIEKVYEELLFARLVKAQMARQIEKFQVGAN
jgi:hypothetical protein